MNAASSGRTIKKRPKRKTKTTNQTVTTNSHKLSPLMLEGAARLDQVLSELVRKAANAAEPRKNKPTMWAYYYRRMERDLRAAFEGVPLDQVENRRFSCRPRRWSWRLVCPTRWTPPMRGQLGSMRDE